MIFKHKQIAASILLAFVLGIATVSVHAAAHLSAEATDCNLCLVYSDQPAEGKGGVFELNPSVQDSSGCEHPPKVSENASVRRLFARGPPKSTK
jgi:hypothetical protein